jgi:hypothetical protein
MKAWFLIPLFFTPAIAFAAPGELCFEQLDDMCGILSGDPAQMFGSVRQPLESQIEGFSLVILWGGLLGIIWFKSENIMLLAIVGIFVSATIVGLSETAKGIGMLLLGISIGILIFQLIRQRVNLYN